jgi:malate dehydrogenase
MRPKVTVVGSGNVGATVAQYIAHAELADVVLVDILEGIPQGKGLDLWEAGPVGGSDARVRGTNDYADTAQSDVVVITAGLARKPGMSRDDLLMANASILTDVVGKVVPPSPQAVLVVVTNPLDVMAQLAFAKSGFPRERVVGMAGILDSARFRTFVADALKVSVESVSALVLGGHGDTMVPLPRYTTVGGVPIGAFLSHDQIAALIKRTREGGAEIVSLLKAGSAYYAPGLSVFEMVEAILKDKRKVLPCAVYLEGEYGIKGVFAGVPVILGRGGVEKVLEIPLQTDEREALHASAAAVKALTDKLGI